MTPVDDLRVGQFITVVKDRQFEQGDHGVPFAVFPLAHREYYSGIPLEIVAISLPFLCVTDGNEKYALDARFLVFQRVNMDYVREMSTPKTPRVNRHLARKLRWREESRNHNQPTRKVDAE